MRTIAVLCDRVSDAGGAERYWETVLPALLERGVRVRLLAREVTDVRRFGAEACAVPWGGEDDPPSRDAARTVAAELARLRPQTIVTASVFDAAVLDIVRAAPARWLVRIHDHRAFCPTGDRVYPHFTQHCVAAMGGACRAATVLHGCVRGPRPASFRSIASREAIRDRIAAADGVLVSSAHMRAICATNGIAPERIAITPPPLPDAAYAAEPSPRPARRTLLFASRLTPRKGLRSLIGALARLPREERPRLVVAGSGASEERDARGDAARAGLDVVWAGHLAQDALRAAIDEAAAVAVPSLWPEPFGLIGIEAQARGRPAVGYDVGGIPEWIADAGIAVPRGDQPALAGAIRDVLDDDTWPRLAASARRRAEAYRLDAHVERLLTLCDAA